MLLAVFLPPRMAAPKFIQVFHITTEPDVIVKGTYGASLTIDLSFGDQPVEEWIAELEAPYPLLLIDPAWTARFPESAKLIRDKNIPTALLGAQGASYEERPGLFSEQLAQYKEIFGSTPLWFRTQDEYFPKELRDLLWKEEINALGSSVRWEGGKLPNVKDGDIIAVPLDDKQRVSLKEIEELRKSRSFLSVEDVLFAASVKTRKIPE